MSGDVHEAGPGLSLKLWEASHVFWVSGFGERPEERGGDFFGWIPTQSGFYSWLVSAESALPRLRGEGNYLSQGRSQTGERTQNPDLEPFGYTLTHVLYVYTISMLWIVSDLVCLYYFNTVRLLTFYFI